MITDGAVGTADIANIAVIGTKIGKGEVTMAKINQSGAATGQVIKWNSSQGAPADDAVGSSDNVWVRGTPDSVLYTIRQLGSVRGGANNMLFGSARTPTPTLGLPAPPAHRGRTHGWRRRVQRGKCGDATVAGGYSDTGAGDYGFAGGYNTRVRGRGLHLCLWRELVNINSPGSYILPFGRSNQTGCWRAEPDP